MSERWSQVWKYFFLNLVIYSEFRDGYYVLSALGSHA